MQVLLVMVVVGDVMVVAGHGIQDMVVLIHMLWVVTINTKVTQAEAGWYRYHGHKYK